MEELELRRQREQERVVLYLRLELEVTILFQPQEREAIRLLLEQEVIAPRLHQEHEVMHQHLELEVILRLRILENNQTLLGQEVLRIQEHVLVHKLEMNDLTEPFLLLIKLERVQIRTPLEQMISVSPLLQEVRNQQPEQRDLEILNQEVHVPTPLFLEGHKLEILVQEEVTDNFQQTFDIYNST